MNLWHGVALKAPKGLSDEFNKEDYHTVTGEFAIKPMSCYSDIEKIVSLGYPRNDYFYEEASDMVKAFLKSINAESFDKLIIWMPTYRKSDSKHISEEYFEGDTGLPIISSIEELDGFNEELEKLNVLVVFKIHHLQMDCAAFTKKYSNIMVLRDQDLFEYGVQLYQFVSESDALITDYSTIFFDYYLLNKPIIFTLADYEEYKASRGFLLENPKDYFAGYHTYDRTQLIDAISDVKKGNDPFKNSREELVKKLNLFTEGNSSKRILDLMGIKKHDV